MDPRTGKWKEAPAYPLEDLEPVDVIVARIQTLVRQGDLRPRDGQSTAFNNDLSMRAVTIDQLVHEIELDMVVVHAGIDSGEDVGYDAFEISHARVKEAIKELRIQRLDRVRYLEAKLDLGDTGRASLLASHIHHELRDNFHRVHPLAVAGHVDCQEEFGWYRTDWGESLKALHYLIGVAGRESSAATVETSASRPEFLIRMGRTFELQGPFILPDPWNEAPRLPSINVTSQTAIPEYQRPSREHLVRRLARALFPMCHSRRPMSRVAETKRTIKGGKSFSKVRKLCHWTKTVPKHAGDKVKEETGVEEDSKIKVEEDGVDLEAKKADVNVKKNDDDGKVLIGCLEGLVPGQDSPE